MSDKPIRVLQYRVNGPSAGTRVLRRVTGLHRWRIKLWLHLADGGRDERVITVDQPCAPTALAPIYDAELREMSAGTPTVTAGGADAWLLPPLKSHHRPQSRA